MPCLGSTSVTDGVISCGLQVRRIRSTLLAGLSGPDPATTDTIPIRLAYPMQSSPRERSKSIIRGRTSKLSIHAWAVLAAIRFVAGSCDVTSQP